MKKLYTLVFLIINFNQILCSTVSDDIQIKIGKNVSMEGYSYFVDLEISNNGKKYSKRLKIDEWLVDLENMPYSLKPGAVTLLGDIILPYTEGILNSDIENPGTYFSLSKFINFKISYPGMSGDEILSDAVAKEDGLAAAAQEVAIAKAAKEEQVKALAAIAKAAAQAKALAEAQAKVAKVAALKTLAEKLGVKESDLKSIGAINWVREIFGGKPLAEDQRLLLRLQKAFLKKLRSPSIGTDNAIKSLTALLEINNLLTDKSDKLAIKGIFDFLTVSVRKKVMTELKNELKKITMTSHLQVTKTVSAGIDSLGELILKNIPDLNMKRILLDVAKNSTPENFDNLLKFILKDPTFQYGYNYYGAKVELGTIKALHAAGSRTQIVVINDIISQALKDNLSQESRKYDYNQLPSNTPWQSELPPTENFFQPLLQDQL